MQIAVLGPLVLLANFGLEDDDGDVDADLGRGGSMKVKFTTLEELRQWVELCGACAVEEPAEAFAEVAAGTRGISGRQAAGASRHGSQQCRERVHAGGAMPT